MTYVVDLPLKWFFSTTIPDTRLVIHGTTQLNGLPWLYNFSFSYRPIGGNRSQAQEQQSQRPHCQRSFLSRSIDPTNDYLIEDSRKHLYKSCFSTKQLFL